MSSTATSRVLSLLAHWEKEHEAGRDLPPEELCKETPELLEQVKAQLQLLQDFPSGRTEQGKGSPASGKAGLYKVSSGAVIAGRYQLVEQIGQGGMGCVWKAEQSQPVKRQVALKLILTHRNSTQVIRRFEAERQALALMDHPNIARIYDGGISDWGDPYFVMELVQGVPLTQYCDEHRLNVQQRLELMVTICQAVQHAHQKGIIHRDLKPGNILVTEVDGKPVPKVIDFGVAKATEQRLTEETMNDTGMIVGTPAYMSPEQADPDTIDIDTRADIYALGVILHELLTGTPPIDAKQFQRGAWMEMLCMVREQDPPRLTTKLSQAEDLPNIAANRSTEPLQLARAVQGDLDWIVLKALEKDRTRRYDTANGLAADVQRHLSGEAVLAHPPSRWYLAQKFVKRNRGQVLAAGLVLAALILGIVGTSWQAIRAAEARDEEARQRGIAQVKEREATAEKTKALAAAEQERKAKLQAEANLEYARKGNEILGSVFEGLKPSTIAESRRPLQDVLRENLKQAAKELDGSALGDHLTVARMQNTLGCSLLALGEYALSAKLLEKARNTIASQLGANHVDYRTIMNNLAEGYHALGQYDKALLLSEENLKVTKALLGPEHQVTLALMGNLAGSYDDAEQYDKAIAMYEETVKGYQKTLGPDHASTLILQGNLAACYEHARQFSKALPLAEDNLNRKKAKLGANHPTTLRSMNILARCYESSGQREKSLSLYEASLSAHQKHLGPDHPSTLYTMNNLAMTYEKAGLLDRAVPLLEETVKLKKTKLGPDHPETLRSMSNLVLAYKSSNQRSKALLLREEMFHLTKAKFGTNHPDTLDLMNRLAFDYQAAGKHDKALPLLEETLKARKARLGADHQDTIMSMGNLAKCYLRMKLMEKSLPLFDEFISSISRLKGSESPGLTGILSQVAQDLLGSGQYIPAEKYLRQGLAIRQKMAPDGWNTFSTESLLGAALSGQKKYAEAEPYLLQGYAGMKQQIEKQPKGSTDIPDTLDRLIQLYTVTNKPDDVKKWQAEKDRWGKESPARK